MTELPKTFDPAAIESRWYAHWEERGLFRPERPGAEPWTIVNPPPNVTGSLHIGHALDNTLQDILTRHARLKGRDARWVVGTDHAGIATQMVVERNLAKQGVERTDLTREEFLSRVWEWKDESGGAITAQLRRLGCSMDWTNERFTMDEGFSAAVLKVFVQLHREGLLYRDKRLVNWDPGLGTAISDLEVETREVQGKFWHLRYPLADGSGHIEVSTTRPKTMLADMAVAVHPNDPRYQHLIGQHVRLPITGRLVPVIADPHADPELGSGAVKITPGHDRNDFDVGIRAGMRTSDMLNMLDANACIVQTSDGLIPPEFIGLDRIAGTDAVVGRLAKEGALLGAEDRVIQLPHGDRSGEVIEPWLTDQWYVDAVALAAPAVEAVRSGAIRIVPKTWEPTFFSWMENIQPWCVSRQLWWGHRIPAWFGPPGAWLDFSKPFHERQYDWSAYPPTFVAESEADALLQADEFYRGIGDLAGKHLRVFIGDDTGLRVNGDDVTITIRQDYDVLDTWFSSALWPFATLGWPDQSPPRDGEGDHAQHGGGGEPRTPLSAIVDNPLHRSATPNGPPPRAGEDRTLAGRYPNDVLISGFDILFFWDARMMMQGLHFMKEVPFRTLYLHGLVRAADGQKMSKSKGNTVDPLGLIDRYGADALRFFMAAMESQGRDIKMDERRVEGYRNFATKLWNAARFCQANGIGGAALPEPPAAMLAVNKWIVAETIACVQEIDLALADLRFDAAANAIYQFTWSRFCDWYLELIKGQVDDETRAVAGWVLDQILVLLHPFMPFITEELWHALASRDHALIVAHWPQPDARALDPAAEREIDWLIRLVGDIRAARTELNVPPGARLPLHVRDAAPETLARIDRQRVAIARLARADVAPGAPEGGAAQVVVDEATFLLPLAGVIDLDAERTRLAKAIAAAEKERDQLAGRLNNASFVERAKPEAVEKARADHAEKSTEAARLHAALGRLG